jgi:hypothetical protein
VESGFEKDPLDCVSFDFVPPIEECSSDSGVAPTGGVAGYSEEQLGDFGGGYCATWTSVLADIDSPARKGQHQKLRRPSIHLPESRSSRTEEMVDIKEPTLA